jgi:hypothetical protein
MKLAKKIAAFVSVMLIAAFAYSAVLRDQQLDDSLQGAWCNSDDGGKTCWGFDVFEPGTSRFCGRSPSDGQVMSGSSRYAISGNRICHMITSSNNASIFPIGERMCFVVLDIDASKQIFKSIEDDEENTTYRTRLDNVRCPAGV